MLENKFKERHDPVTKSVNMINKRVDQMELNMNNNVDEMKVHGPVQQPVQQPTQPVPQAVQPAVHDPVQQPVQQSTLPVPQAVQPAVHGPVQQPVQQSTQPLPQAVQPAVHSMASPTTPGEASSSTITTGAIASAMENMLENKFKERHDP